MRTEAENGFRVHDAVPDLDLGVLNPRQAHLFDSLEQTAKVAVS